MDGMLTSENSILVGFTSCIVDNSIHPCIGKVVTSDIKFGMIVSNQGGKNGNA